MEGAPNPAEGRVRRYRPPSLLHLRVGLKEWTSPEDAADAKFLEAAGAPAAPGVLDEAGIPPDRIPRVFTGLRSWPHRTNLPCWQCDFTFDDRPKFACPYIRETGGGTGVEADVVGNMCTFNCVQLWIDIHHRGKDTWRQLSENNCLLYYMFTGRRVTRIQPAHCAKSTLRKYGVGTWDEETFWREQKKLDPIAGLRDHLGLAVMPERLRAEPEETRVRAVVEKLRAADRASAAQLPRVVSTAPSGAAIAGHLRVGVGSVWHICGLAATSESSAATGPTTSEAPSEDVKMVIASEAAGTARTEAADETVSKDGDSAVSEAASAATSEDIGAAASEGAAAGPTGGAAPSNDLDDLLAELETPSGAFAALTAATSGGPADGEFKNLDDLFAALDDEASAAPADAVELVATEKSGPPSEAGPTMATGAAAPDIAAADAAAPEPCATVTDADINALLFELAGE